MIELRAATAAHFSQIEIGRFDAISVPRSGLAIVGQFWADKAVAAVEDGQVLGIAGIIKRGDEGVVAMLLSDALRRRPHFLHRVVKRHMVPMMERQGINKLHATVHRDFNIARRWIERLGFVYKGTDGVWLRYVYERN